MKKILLLVLVCSLVVLSSCENEYEPIEEDIDISQYEEILNGDNYILYQSTEIPNFQNDICFSFVNEKGINRCLEHTVTNAYIVSYKDVYISIQSGYELGLFTVEELELAGVFGIIKNYDPLENVDLSLYRKVLVTSRDVSIFVLNEEEYVSNNAFDRFLEGTLDECNLFYEENLVYIVEYEDKYFTVDVAINREIITEDDAVSFNIKWECLMLEFVESDPVGCSVYNISSDIGTSEDPKPVTTLGEYDIYYSSLTCQAVVGNIIIDGYYFGYFTVGCDDDLDNIGYYAMLNGEYHGLQNLVDDGVFTVEEIYNMYMCLRFSE